MDKWSKRELFLKKKAEAKKTKKPKPINKKTEKKDEPVE